MSFVQVQTVLKGTSHAVVCQDQSECSYLVVTHVDAAPALQLGLFISRDLALKLKKSVNNIESWLK